MIGRLLCFLSLHKFSEPDPLRGTCVAAIAEFETVCCIRCKRKWVVNTRNQKVFEVIR